MKFLKYAAMILLIVAAATLALQAGDSQGTGDTEKQKVAPKGKHEIDWMRFDEGLAALDADTTGKHMFIDFTASWCGWCKKMDRETFADPKVIDAVNRGFIPVKVWGDSNDMLDINGYQISERNLSMAEFKVNSYPAFYFMSPEKSKIGPLRGYQTSPNLLKALTWVSEAQYDTTSAKTPAQGQTDKPKVKSKPKN